MPASPNTFSPQPYASKSIPGLHSGVVSVTGTKEVDLGIGHNNFVATVSLKSKLAADANKASALSWTYGSKPGSILISAWKATGAGVTTLIAATAAVDVSFIVEADSSVG